MADNTFNPELDKITERETVYDFVNRVRIGKDIKNYNDASLHSYALNTDVLYSPPMKLEEIISRLTMMQKETIAANTHKIYTVAGTFSKSAIAGNIGGQVILDIPKNVTITSTTNLNNLIDYRIYLERAGVDITPLGVGLSVVRNTDTTVKASIAVQWDCGLKNEEIVKVYFWFK